MGRGGTIPQLLLQKYTNISGALTIASLSLYSSFAIVEASGLYACLLSGRFYYSGAQRGASTRFRIIESVRSRARW